MLRPGHGGYGLVAQNCAILQSCGLGQKKLVTAPQSIPAKVGPSLRDVFAGQSLESALSIASRVVFDQLAMMRKMTKEQIPFNEDPSFVLYVFSYHAIAALDLGYNSQIENMHIVSSQTGRMLAHFGYHVPDAFEFFSQMTKQNRLLTERVYRQAGEDLDEAIRGGIPMGLFKIRHALKGPIQTS